MAIKRPFVKRVFVCDEERYDLPFHYYGRLCFDVNKFMEKPYLYNLVVLTGGEDLNPSLYGQRMNKFCGTPNNKRDAKDLAVAYAAIRCGIPIVGVCRGAQLINIIAGGQMIQDCDNHTVWHDVITEDGDIMEVSSTHHQMMVPPKNQPYKLLAWAHPSRTTACFSSSKKKPHKGPEKEPDCMYFPKQKALAMQYHPEYVAEGSPAFELSQKLIEKYLGVKRLNSKLRDTFISLPKPKQTRKVSLLKNGIYKSLSKEGRAEFSNREFMEGFMLNRVRKLRSQLMMEDQAIQIAAAELEEFLTAAQKGNEELDAVRASGASE